MVIVIGLALHVASMGLIRLLTAIMGNTDEYYGCCS